MTEHLTTARATADTNVAAAVQEADEAAALAAALEERVRNGDNTVTPAQIANARELGNFAQLRADATRRQAEAAKRDARLADLAQLKADIDAYQADNGDQAAALLDTVYDALNTYVDHVQAHTRRITAWRQRMTDLDVPAHKGPSTPPAEHGRLARQADGSIIAGDTVHRTVNPWPALDTILTAARHHADGRTHSLRTAQEKTTDAKKSVKAMAPRPQVTPGLVHYRGTGGAILTYDPDKAPTPDDIRRLKLTPITDTEAYA
ncbi:hypothetical protein ACUN3E_05235 [Streptomyces sp. Ju416(a)]|uniref:hypothetical protein n=1 Tax=Streptomyces sp. Ju416(a) TaxID=3446591 RepID=UPI00403DAB87